MKVLVFIIETSDLLKKKSKSLLSVDYLSMHMYRNVNR